MLGHYHWMQRALFLAKRAAEEGEVPVGAVIVKDNQVIAEGWNQSIQLHDPTAHAEMQAIRKAGKVLQNYRLIKTKLYVTLEPCAMCATAMVHARIDELIYGATDPKCGAAGSLLDLTQQPEFNHKIQVSAGELKDDCQAQLKQFFQSKR